MGGCREGGAGWKGKRLLTNDRPSERRRTTEHCIRSSSSSAFRAREPAIVGKHASRSSQRLLVYLDPRQRAVCGVTFKLLTSTDRRTRRVGTGPARIPIGQPNVM